MAKRIPGAFICARYSTDNQSQDSIEVQAEACAKWCAQHAVPVLGIFADEAVSGMKETRPQYEEMMRRLRLGEATMVVIYDQSRLFRRMTSWFLFREEMTSLGVKIISVTQPLVGLDIRDPANFLMEGSSALFNQMWALQSRQKTMAKMRFMARNGQYTGGKPALGYKVVDGKLRICEEEAAVVRRIFREYADGRSYRDIIAGLNADGIKTKRGNAFGSNSLHDLMHNEKYIGTLVYGQSPYREDGTRNTHAKDGEDPIRIEDAIPAIIDKETFRIVQERMAQNKRQQGGRPPKNREYPLRGKVFCAACKSAMTISTSKGEYYYYRCTGKKRLHNCEASPISVDQLERIVAQALRNVLGAPSKVNGLIRILRDQAEQITAGSVERLATLLEQEREIQKQLDNAIDAILSGLSSPALKEKITALEKRKAEINVDLNALKRSVDAASIPENRLREILDYIIHSDNAALMSIVYRVEVSDDFITIWTILDSDPTGHIDTTQEGVTITPGTSFAVPIVIVTSQFLRITVARNYPS